MSWRPLVGGARGFVADPIGYASGGPHDSER